MTRPIIILKPDTVETGEFSGEFFGRFRSSDILISGTTGRASRTNAQRELDLNVLN